MEIKIANYNNKNHDMEDIAIFLKHYIAKYYNYRHKLII